MNIRAGCVALGLACAALSGCGRSENVGWQDRNPPAAGSQSAASSQQQSEPGANLQTETTPEQSAAPVTKSEEYQQLAQSLEQLRMQALQDSEIVAATDEMNALMEAELAKRTAFHDKLVGRKNEIEQILESADEGNTTLSQAQRDTLAFNYYNIEQELAPYRSSLFREPEYAQLLEEFQLALFAKMRELDPARGSDIDRLERLGSELFEELESMIAEPESPPGG